jgi:hypothetical protein
VNPNGGCYLEAGRLGIDGQNLCTLSDQQLLQKALEGVRDYGLKYSVDTHAVNIKRFPQYNSVRITMNQEPESFD